jgi:hypothetical protein
MVVSVIHFLGAGIFSNQWTKGFAQTTLRDVPRLYPGMTPQEPAFSNEHRYRSRGKSLGNQGSNGKRKERDAKTRAKIRGEKIPGFFASPISSFPPVLSFAEVGLWRCARIYRFSDSRFPSPRVAASEAAFGRHLVFRLIFHLLFAVLSERRPDVFSRSSPNMSGMAGASEDQMTLSRGRSSGKNPARHILPFVKINTPHVDFRKASPPRTGSLSRLSGAKNPAGGQKAFNSLFYTNSPRIVIYFYP